MNALCGYVVAGATTAMAAVNAVVDPHTTMKTMNKFSTEMDKMEVATETWDDMVDMFDGDNVEEESDEVVDQVMSELGISLGEKMQEAPTSVFNLPNAAAPQQQRQAAATSSSNSTVNPALV